MTTDKPHGELPAMRELTDPSTIRALTHPVRLALLEVLATEGALTATEAGELIGESPTTCSFHFRQLEKYGFTEVAATGPGRQRRWKIAQLGMNFSDTTDDAELNIAATSLSRLVTDRAIARMQQFQDTKSNFPKEWQEVSESTEAVLFVTPNELSELNEQVLAVLMRYHSRLTEIDQRPEGSLPVEVLVFRYPVRFSGAAQ
jgi:predicted ArsR family transcriptional regulator